jgi:hypothetical protein
VFHAAWLASTLCKASQAVCVCVCVCVPATCPAGIDSEVKVWEPLAPEPDSLQGLEQVVADNLSHVHTPQNVLFLPLERLRNLLLRNRQ